MRARELMESALSVMVYHGTTKADWEKKIPAETDLYLATTRENAEGYADDRYTTCFYRVDPDGDPQVYVPQCAPIIVEFRLADLQARGLNFQPDWGWDGCQDDTPWEESMREVGSFCVSFNEADKDLGRITLAYPDFHKAQTLTEGSRPVDAFLAAVNEIGKEYYRFSDQATFRTLNGTIVRLEAYGPSEANLMEISTTSPERKKGHGTAMLKQVCDLADKYRITLYGNAYPIRKAIYDLPMPQEALTAWYLRHGFEIADEPARRGVNIVRKPK